MTEFKLKSQNSTQINSNQQQLAQNSNQLRHIPACSNSQNYRKAKRVRYQSLNTVETQTGDN